MQNTMGRAIPTPPPLPPTTMTHSHFRFNNQWHQSASIMAARGMWDEAYMADVIVHSDSSGKIYAHAGILGMASPVMKSMLKQSRKGSITLRGVPHEAVRVFIRFLYTSSCDPADMEELALHLLVMSHAFAVPQLKRECEDRLEKGMLHTENVVDIFQLAMLCDASRLSLICHRMILRTIKIVSETDGWMAMKEAHPVLENRILQSVAQAETMQKLTRRKREERKMYVQLYKAMEALVHICKDGCRTIGPHDKMLKEGEGPCMFDACKGLELLVRHFTGCKMRVRGGCAHCKRMRRLFDLHSRLCSNSGSCKVPLCAMFKERSRKHNKKEDIKWNLLANKIVRSKSISGAPYFSLVVSH